MGLEENADAGLDIEDLVNIYKGHIKDRYQVSIFTDVEWSECRIYVHALLKV